MPLWSAAVLRDVARFELWEELFADDLRCQTISREYVDSLPAMRAYRGSPIRAADVDATPRGWPATSIVSTSYRMRLQGNRTLCVPDSRLNNMNFKLYRTECWHHSLRSAHAAYGPLPELDAYVLMQDSVLLEGPQGMHAHGARASPVGPRVGRYPA